MKLGGLKCCEQRSVFEATKEKADKGEESFVGHFEVVERVFLAHWHKAWHSLSFSPFFSFEPCVCVKRSVYTRTVYVWLCVSHTTQWHEKDPAPCLRVFTLGFHSGRRAGRRGLFVFLSLPFVDSSCRFPQFVL